MAYNFKSIADVEVVAEPTESANVLIEENGVIKKAPKTIVGDGMADIVFDATTEYLATTSIPNRTYTLLSGDYTTVIERIKSGKLVSAIGRFTEIDSEGVQMLYSIEISQAVAYNELDDGSSFCMGFSGGRWYLLNPDNTITN